MAIHRIEEEYSKKSDLLYRRANEENWKNTSSTEEVFGKNILRKTVLEDLFPDTEYYFSFGLDSPLYKFRTLKENSDAPLRIAVGGDAYQKVKPYKRMNEVVAKMAPDFVILGGDIAYANRGNPVKRWKTFFRIWCDTMKTEDGRIIPLVSAVGNHEIVSKNKASRQLFCTFFPYLEKKSYGSMETPDSLFLLLDTGHINPIRGKQTDWVKKKLSEKKRYSHKFAIYHIPAYPSIEPYKNKTASLIRENWVPLFEQKGVLVAFENHNHAFKRTYPIAAEKIDPKGVVYIGDGAWSASPRDRSDKRWYLEKRIGTNCFSLLTIHGESVCIQSFDNEGKEIDDWKAGAKSPGKKIN